MTKIDWPQLEAIYRSRSDDDDGRTFVTIADERILATLQLLVEDGQARWASGIVPFEDLEKMEVGMRVEVDFGSPILSLGAYVSTFDRLLLLPGAAFKEPKNYFVREGAVTPQSDPPTQFQLSYRALLSLTTLLEKAAIWKENVHSELIFFHDAAVPVPVRLTGEDLRAVDVEAVEGLVRLFKGGCASKSKLRTLSAAVCALTAQIPRKERFRCILGEVGKLRESVAGLRGMKRVLRGIGRGLRKLSGI